jgi:hypothetical protein
MIRDEHGTVYARRCRKCRDLQFPDVGEEGDLMGWIDA